MLIPLGVCIYATVFQEKKSFGSREGGSKGKTDSPKTKKTINKKVSKILVKHSKIKPKQCNKEETGKRSKIIAMHKGKEGTSHHHKLDSKQKGKEVTSHHHKTDSMHKEHKDHKDKDVLEKHHEIDSTQRDKEVADKHHEIDSKQWDKEVIDNHSEIDLNQWYKHETDEHYKIDPMPTTNIEHHTIPTTKPHSEENLPMPVKRVYTEVITPVESDYLKIQSLTDTGSEEKIKQTLGRVVDWDHMTPVRTVRRHKSKEKLETQSH